MLRIKIWRSKNPQFMHLPYMFTVDFLRSVIVCFSDFPKKKVTSCTQAALVTWQLFSTTRVSLVNWSPGSRTVNKPQFCVRKLAPWKQASEAKFPHRLRRPPNTTLRSGMRAGKLLSWRPYRPFISSIQCWYLKARKWEEKEGEKINFKYKNRQV